MAFVHGRAAASLEHTTQIRHDRMIGLGDKEEENLCQQWSVDLR